MLLWAKLLQQGISIGLSIFNQILRYLVIFIVTWIGYRTETGQLKVITICTFVVQFFNTAFVLLLVNADLTEQPMVTYGLNSGQNGDFNASFFRTIGNTLIGTMMFNAIYPVIEFFMYWGMRAAFRQLDRGCSCNNRKTKKTSVQQYIDLYSGPVYMMHYKYSTILNVTFVTFMYGFGMPYLFPVAIYSLIVLYFIEKTMLYYSYRSPPMYDEKTYEMVLRVA